MFTSEVSSREGLSGKVHRRISWTDENVDFNLGDGYIVSIFVK